MNDVYDVAVVGYGPTGLVAASLLGQLGHEVVVIERWPTLYGLPRLTHIDGETARIIQGAGDAGAALRDSTPTEYRWFNGNRQQLLHIPAAEAGRMGYPEHISMYQPDVEEAIDARVRSCANVEVRQGWAVTGLATDDAGVELTLSGWPADGGLGAGASKTVRASYVIAADGAKSAIRTLLGVEREDLGFNERWLNIDTEWLRPMPEAFAGSRQFCDPARGHMYMSIGSRRQRFEFAALEGEERDEMERPEVAWDLLRRTHDLGPDDLRIVRQVLYVFEARIAQRWRVGRVMLAGDAAHTMPPYLGQGACSGMRDASNLAWKLDLVLRGRAGEDLLDTYERERRPHTTVITHMAIGLGRIANMHDAQAAAARDEAFLSGHVPPPPELPILDGGVLAHTDADEPAPGAGVLTPQGRIVRDGRRGLFDDVVGTGFHLVAREDPSGSLDGARRRFLANLGCSIVHFEGEGPDTASDVAGVYARFLETHAACAYIARPDLVAFGFAPEPTGVAALVDELERRLALHAAPVTAGATR